MILVLTGSPNKMGNTNTVLNEFIKDINQEVIVYDAYKSNIKACTDCKFCSFKSGCSIKDTMLDIYQEIERADTLIIASPLYFATLSGELVKLLTRFQTYYANKYVRKRENPQIKKGLLLVTAGGYWPSMFVGVKETFNVLKLVFHMEEVKELLMPNCDDRSPLESDEYKNNLEGIKAFLA